jgi:hypothetical protein
VSPGESLAPVLHDDHIGKEASVPSVSIGEGMNLHQPVMVTNGYLIDVKSSVLKPVVDVSKNCRYPGHDLVEWNTQVFVRLAIPPSPSPGLIEHSPMESPKIRLDEGVFPLQDTWMEGPAIRFQNVRAFKLIQLAFRRKAGP